MTADWLEWLNFALRWLHLIAGIMWIGSSFFFVWLDSNLEASDKTEQKSSAIEGELWMVHSGGFYQVQKLKPGPADMPSHLHWFKWEATFTWLFGFLLFVLVYYLNRGIYLIDPDIMALSAPVAIALSLVILTLSWLVYDILWQSALARHGNVTASISLALLFVLIFLLCHIFSGRAAFIHVGAIMGTLMVLNVWLRILPAQHQMIDATARGEMPDFELGKHAKRRSMHNSYMTLPVLFMMLSNHYPATYGAEHNWLILSLLVIVGASIRHRMISKSRYAPWLWAPITACVIGLLVLSQPSLPNMQSGKIASGKSAAVLAQNIISQRCLRCHSANPSDENIHVAPAGVMFDTPELIQTYADRIKARAVISKTMPLGNKTNMTMLERAQLGAWINTLASREE